MASSAYASFDEPQSIQQLIDNADNQFVKCIRNYDEALKLSESGNADAADKLHDALEQMNQVGAWDY